MEGGSGVVNLTIILLLKNDCYRHAYPQVVEQAIMWPLSASKENGRHRGQVANDGDQGQAVVFFLGQWQVLWTLHKGHEQ